MPCYEDSLEEKKSNCKFFNKENIEINKVHTDALASLLSSERLSLNNELNKLIVYTKMTKKNIIDSLSVLVDSNSQDLNELAYLLASKKKKIFGMNF